MIFFAHLNETQILVAAVKTGEGPREERRRRRRRDPERPHRRLPPGPAVDHARRRAARVRLCVRGRNSRQPPQSQWQ